MTKTVYIGRKDPRHVLVVNLDEGVFSEYELAPELAGVDTETAIPLRRGLISDIEGLKGLRRRIEDTLRKDPRLLISVASHLAEQGHTIML